MELVGTKLLFTVLFLLGKVLATHTHSHGTSEPTHGTAAHDNLLSLTVATSGRAAAKG